MQLNIFRALLMSPKMKDDCNALNGKYGESHDCQWKPCQYAERINVAKQVEDFKRKKYLVI